LPSDRLTAALADRYRIERELGAGGMATVYLADDLCHHRKVALSGRARGEELSFTNDANVFESVRVRSDPDFEIVRRVLSRPTHRQVPPGPGDSLFVAMRAAGPPVDARLVLVRNWIRERAERAAATR
jgi:hypothetical protein